MQVLKTIQAMRLASKRLRHSATPKTLGLVPTMGALHPGHLSLVRAARQSCDAVAVSIFVNPLQFGPQEDFARYPRSFAQDVALLESEGVDFVFAPSVEEMYPQPPQTIVDVPAIGARLDGAARPGHFQGVATVVSKLFHIVAPDRAFFGQKDAAQVAVLRAMVRDLNFDLDLIVCPTVREPDGLAMSSRNAYLHADERQHALALSHALTATEQAIQSGKHRVDTLRKLLRSRLRKAAGLELEYAEIVDADTLAPLDALCGHALLAVAARVGATRLIDNLVLDLGARPTAEQP